MKPVYIRTALEKFRDIQATASLQGRKLEAIAVNNDEARELFKDVFSKIYPGPFGIRRPVPYTTFLESVKRGDVELYGTKLSFAVDA